MFLLLMINYTKDRNLEYKYFNAFCRGEKKCVDKVLLVRLGEMF